MARTPLDEEKDAARYETRKSIRNAKDRFRSKGKKPFRVDSRIGVIPQDVYDRHRHPSDPDYKAPKEEA